MTLHTITDVFYVHLKGYSCPLDRKNRLERLGPKKGATVLRGLKLPKS
jgi:hypothetical protein